MRKPRLYSSITFPSISGSASTVSTASCSSGSNVSPTEVDRLNTRVRQCVLKTRGDPAKTFENRVCATRHSVVGIDRAIQIVDHREERSDEFRLLGCGAFIGRTIQTLSCLVSFALQLLAQLIETRLHFLHLLFRRLGARFEFFNVLGLRLAVPLRFVDAVPRLRRPR